MNEEVTQSASGAAAAQAEVRVKPLSDNAFLAFFQKIWRWGLGVWYGFADKHPKGSKLIQQFAVMFLFSNLVTIFQALIMIFLPYAFQEIWDVPFVWPAVALPWQDAAGNALNYAIFNEPVKFLLGNDTFIASTPEQVQQYMDLGYELQMSGLGNFIAFEIATFLAQCINFPLQRNITFKSKGNPVVQGIWYFIGWIAISVGVNAIWGIMNLIMMWWNWNEAVIAIIKTVLTGGVSVVIFFFIFLAIFPDQQKLADKAAKKAEALKNSGAAAEEIAAAEAKAVELAENAKLEAARKEALVSDSAANSRAVSWEASKKMLEKMKSEGKSEEDIAAQEKIVADKYNQALEAAVKRDEAIAANEAAIREVEAARAARA